MGKEKRTATSTAASSGLSGTMELDLARLFGRTPTSSAVVRGSGPNIVVPQSQIDLSTPEKTIKDESRWKGSGLGVEWDDRVGAGAAAASVVSLDVFYVMWIF